MVELSLFSLALKFIFRLVKVEYIRSLIRAREYEHVAASPGTEKGQRSQSTGELRRREKDYKRDIRSVALHVLLAIGRTVYSFFELAQCKHHLYPNHI
ncbi:unnamed protein product [Caenorhabditis nigoni]